MIQTVFSNKGINTINQVQTDSNNSFYENNEYKQNERSQIIPV